MMNIRKKHLAIAVAGAACLGTMAAHAETFTASTTLQNTLTVVNIQNLDIGTVFASATGAALADGVGALVISPAGTVTDPAGDSVTVNLTSLTAPVAAQASVAMTTDFSLTLPDTSAIDPVDFAADGGSTLAQITPTNATELVHESANPSVPSLWLMHFTIEAVSGGTTALDGAVNVGTFDVTQDFGETTFVFNIGGTLTTQPGTGTALDYQEGLYSGTFEVTAAY